MLNRRKALALRSGAFVWLTMIVTSGASILQGADASIFDYDHNAPLRVDKRTTREVDRASIVDLSFESPKGGRVPAFLVLPKKTGSRAGIVYVHWGQGDRSSFLAEAVLMARLGAASVLIDAPSRRPAEGRPTGGLDNPEGDLQSWAQGVVDARRAVDLLLSDGGVDPHRLAYVGHSYGATIGGAIAVSERRFRGLVLMGGFDSLTDAFRLKEIPLDPATPVDKLDRYLRVLATIDADQYIGQAAPAKLLMQFARVDRFVTERQAKAYERAASSPKQVTWYEGGHDFFDPRALSDRGAWLCRLLGMNSNAFRKLLDSR